MEINQTKAQKSLFAVQTRWGNIGTIREYIVIKETPKTYVVTLPETINSLRCNCNTVHKSDMQIYDRHYCESYVEALVYKKQLLQKSIESYTRRITEMQSEIERYTVMIKETDSKLAIQAKGGEQ